MLRSKLLRLRGFQGAPAFYLSVFPNLGRKVSNSLSAVQDTYLSTKKIFERHRIVFTISTSLASLLTAWAGYSLRYHHQAKVEKRLDSIEQTLKSSSDVRREEINKIVSSGGVSNAACLATACTTLVIGYGLGWRGGSWFAHRKFQRAQSKSMMMEQNKPGRWQLLKKKLSKPRILMTNPKAAAVSSPSHSGGGSVGGLPHQKEANPSATSSHQRVSQIS